MKQMKWQSDRRVALEKSDEDRSAQANSRLAVQGTNEHNPLWQSLAIRSGIVQAKKPLGKKGNPYDQEADADAEPVKRMADPNLQPVLACGASPRCQKGQDDKAADLTERKARTGKPLPADLRSYFEERFGHDFSEVRVSAEDPEVEAHKAAAVTRGWQIAFAPGQWNAGTSAGQRLLAHELSHVVQQTRNGNPIGQQEAEQQAEHAATRLSLGSAAPQLGARPFGNPAAQPQATQPQAGQPQMVPATQVEKLAADIERVVATANLPGIKAPEIAGVIAVLRDYGNTGRVVWGDTDGALALYDDLTDVIMLSAERFNFDNLGPIAAVTVFHEASHATRWRIGGALADAEFAADLSRKPNEEGLIKANVNRELKLYREETLAHHLERDVLYSYFVETGVSTAEQAAESLAGFDPTTGASALACRDRLVELLKLYGLQTGREVEAVRFLQDAEGYARTGEKMPDLSAYLR